MFMMARLPQPEKALYPMLVTLFGMFMLARGVPPKAISPRLVTPSGKVTLVILVFSKALSPMLVTLLKLQETTVVGGSTLC
jgi:hypothetical protein